MRFAQRTSCRDCTCPFVSNTEGKVIITGTHTQQLFYRIGKMARHKIVKCIKYVSKTENKKFRHEFFALLKQTNLLR